MFQLIAKKNDKDITMDSENFFIIYFFNYKLIFIAIHYINFVKRQFEE